MADINQLLMEEAAPEDQDIMEGIMASLDDVLMPKNNVMVDQSPLQPQLQKNSQQFPLSNPSLKKHLLASLFLNLVSWIKPNYPRKTFS